MALAEKKIRFFNKTIVLKIEDRNLELESEKNSLEMPYHYSEHIEKSHLRQLQKPKMATNTVGHYVSPY